MANTELDYMEYATDGAAQAAYLTNGHHAITFAGTAQLDTAAKKWGTASLLVDGDSDCLTLADNADWDICGSSSDDWTIDFWVKHADHAGDECYMSQVESWPASNKWWQFHHADGSGINFLVYDAGVEIINSGNGGEITDTNWHHIAMCKVGSLYACYLDGSQVNYVNDASTATFAGSLYIGAFYNATNWFYGQMDEIRIQHSNSFGAAPNATPDDTIVVPTSSHQTDTNTKLLLHLDGADEAVATVDWSRLESRSEGTIKQQGSYSLGCFANTDAINDTLTCTVDPTISLVDLDTIYFDIKQSNIAGSIKVGIHDSGGTTTEKTVTVAGHAVTFAAAAKLDTADYKWGSASLLLDGTSDYLTIPDSADWDVCASNSDDWTIDLFVKHDDHADIEIYIEHGVDGNDWWAFRHDHGTGIGFYLWDSGAVIQVAGGEITDTDWHHVAMCKVANEYGVYLDGTQTAYVLDSDVRNYTGSLFIGYHNHATVHYHFDGHMDDIRIIHSNIFGAAPNATPNDTITPPTGAHTGDADTKLLLHLDGADAAVATIDSSRDYWQTQTWDISGVSNANKDAIDSIIFTILNADNDNTFYLDNMYGLAVAAAVNFMLGCNF